MLMEIVGYGWAFARVYRWSLVSTLTVFLADAHVSNGLLFTQGFLIGIFHEIPHRNLSCDLTSTDFIDVKHWTCQQTKEQIIQDLLHLPLFP